jgi:hypothetical protein
VVHVVDVDRDAGLESEVEVVLADAADERSHRVSEGGLSGTERGIRHRVRHVGGERECTHFQLFRVDRGDRDRDFLQPLVAVARGDDDFLERALYLGFDLLRHCRARREHPRRHQHAADRSGKPRMPALWRLYDCRKPLRHPRPFHVRFPRWMP